MGQYALPCIVCGVQLENIDWNAGLGGSASENQPSEGTAFWTTGHYGSTFFDPMDGQALEITVCDDCLERHKNRIAWRRMYRLLHVDHMIVGRQVLDTPLVPYTGQDETSEGTELDPAQIGEPIEGVTWFWQQINAFRRRLPVGVDLPAPTQDTER